MKFLRQRQASGRRRVDFHIRRNRQAEENAMHVNADVAAKVIRVRREPTAMADRNPELDFLFGT